MRTRDSHRTIPTVGTPWRAVVALSAAALLVVLTPAGSAVADPPDREGRITFMRQDAAGFWQTWIARPDLSRQRQVTHEPANSGWPVWSPTRNLLALDSDRSDPDPADDEGINDIFVLRPNGSGLRQVTDSVGFSSDPAWSPDGSWIAFSADRGAYPSKQGIYLTRRNGTDLHRVTRLPTNASLDSAPRFSPDGKRLVFTRYFVEGDVERGALFTVAIEGRHPRQVTSTDLGAGDATWSPDGRRLAFEAYPDQESFGDIYAVDPDGKRLRNLTHNESPLAGSADPVWSPDGRRILFLDAHRSTADEPFTQGLATMTVIGGDRHFLSTHPVEQHQPDWKPDRRP